LPCRNEMSRRGGGPGGSHDGVACPQGGPEALPPGHHDPRGSGGGGHLPGPRWSCSGPRNAIRCGPRVCMR